MNKKLRSQPAGEVLLSFSTESTVRFQCAKTHTHTHKLKTHARKFGREKNTKFFVIEKGLDVKNKLKPNKCTRAVSAQHVKYVQQLK
jgi:hypothetical protein